MSGSNAYFVDDESSALMSVSDVMAGLLFVFIITLVAFIINFQEAADRQEAINTSLTNADDVRRQMLEEIEVLLVQRGIKVEIDEEHGVLRLTEAAVTFDSAKATLDDLQLANLATIRQILEAVLPCYAASTSPGCDSAKAGRLDSVLIEGHTDNVPIGEGKDLNWELSADRAIYTYRYVIDESDVLKELRNTRGEPLFSVSGYGDRRPLAPHASPTREPQNRRIELRFIMSAPTVVEPQRELLERGA
jgi:chemotaxis protein MotB